MKKTITTIVLFTSVFFLQAQTVLEQNFETVLTWTTTGTVVNNYTLPSTAPSTDVVVSPVEGSKMLELNSSIFNAETDSYIKSEAFTLDGTSSHFLSFWSCRKFSTDYSNPTIEAYFKETVTGTTTTILTSTPSNQGEWIFNEIEIPSSFNSTYDLHIINKQPGHNSAARAFLDNIKITKQSISSIGSLELSSLLKSYAFNNQIKLTSAIDIENAIVSIVGLSGKVILNENKNLVKNENITLTTESLSNGIYIVNVSDGKNSFSEKLIIK